MIAYIYMSFPCMSADVLSYSLKRYDDRHIFRTSCSINAYLCLLLYTLHNQQIEHIGPPSNDVNNTSENDFI